MTRWRGHPIARRGDVWVYVDTGELVSSDPERLCGHCGLPNTDAGHDGCLGTLQGAVNACCGHGDVEADPYIQFSDGTELRGPAALAAMEAHRTRR